MCGIFGIIYFNKNLSGQDSKLLQNATELLAHRGPDDSGFYVNENVGLGHKRLSIIDLEAGHQPMLNENKTIVTVFNGEIYNYKELMEKLKKSHRFKTNSDTEVLVHGYEEDGGDFVKKLNGMFAYAIYDKTKQELYLYRDRMGIKPLYYYYDSTKFIFASEIKAILLYINKNINKAKIIDFIRFKNIIGSETIFSNIHKLLPAHYLKLKNNKKITTGIYWRQEYIRGNEVELYNENNLILKLEDLLVDSIRKRMISDVPIASFLSGGLDSGLITAIMQNICRPQKVKSFTIGFKEKNFSEEDNAKISAMHLKTEHHEYQLSKKDFFQMLPKLIWHNDMPIADIFSIPIYYMSYFAAKQNIKVILSGEGADENFGGYYFFKSFLRDINLNKMVPPFLFNLLIKTNIINKDSILYRFFERNSKKGLYRIIERLAYTNENYSYELCNSYLECDKYIIEEYNRVKNYPELKQILILNQKLRLQNLLHKMDRMPMAAAVEVRVPFLDHRLVEFSLSIPNKFLIKNNIQKYILKKVAEKYLPYDIIYQKKQASPTPLKEWVHFKTDRLIEFFKKNNAYKEFLNIDIIMILRKFQKNKKWFDLEFIWIVLNFEIWIMLYLKNIKEEEIRNYLI